MFQFHVRQYLKSISEDLYFYYFYIIEILNKSDGLCKTLLPQEPRKQRVQFKTVHRIKIGVTLVVVFLSGSLVYTVAKAKPILIHHF